MRILFMGTPDFSVFALSALLDAGENVIGVITQPDKPKGRKYVLTPSAVKVFAESRGIAVYTPATLRTEEFAALLAELDPEVIVVSAFGKILPRNVLDYPKHGCINIHGSLLPEYRGAAPMQRAIIDGKTVTGVTIQMMADGIDTGDIILKREVPIGSEDNFEIIHDRLGETGAAALMETLALIRAGGITLVPQDNSLATYASKIEKNDCTIDFSKPAAAVHNLIRGLSPAPLAFTRLPDGKLLKVAQAEVAEDFSANNAAPGTVLALDSGIVVATGGGDASSGAVRLFRVIPEGKGSMSAADFIRGRRVAVGDVFS